MIQSRAAICLGFLVLVNSLASGQSTQIVSLDNESQQHASQSFEAVVSDDARFVAFTAHRDLLPDGSGVALDIFLRDLDLQQTTRINVNAGGEFANNTSFLPSISGDGSLILFSSLASNLIPGDGNPNYDIFGFHRESGSLELISVGPNGESADGASWTPSSSQNGRYVVFESGASNLVPSDTNSEFDIFVRDLTTGLTSRVSVGTNGEQANRSCYEASISANGRYVVFASAATTLVSGTTIPKERIYWRDCEAGVTNLVAAGYRASVSGDGAYVAFSSFESLVPEDSNSSTDIFVKNMFTGEIVRVSVRSNGQQANGFSSMPSISSDGRFVTFQSDASNLVDNDTNNARDIFSHDLFTGRTRQISVSSDGTPGNLYSEISRTPVSANGRYVAFTSESTNLVSNDTNNSRDVFLRDQGECFAFLLADSNCDGTISNADIDAFILALLDPVNYRQQYPNCDLICNNDMNHDGFVDDGDIDAFVEALF